MLSPLVARGENWASERLCDMQNVKPLGEKPQPPEQGFPAQRCRRGAEGAALGIAAVEQRPGPATRLRTTVVEQKSVEQGLGPCAQLSKPGAPVWNCIRDTAQPPSSCLYLEVGLEQRE